MHLCYTIQWRTMLHVLQVEGVVNICETFYLLPIDKGKKGPS